VIDERLDDWLGPTDRYRDLLHEAGVPLVRMVAWEADAEERQRVIAVWRTNLREDLESANSQSRQRAAEILRVLDTPYPTRPPYPGRHITERTWQVPLFLEGDLKGYVDFAVTYTFERLASISFPERLVEHGRWRWNWDTETCGAQAGFVVKLTIPSLVHLFRELSWLHYHFDGRLVVVSPDDRHAELIRSQGYGFVTPEHRGKE
jgi:hypothetical protein